MNVFCIVNQTGHLSSPTRKVRLDEPLAYSNSRAHSFRFTVLAEGSESPADLTGVGVTAQFLRHGNNTTVSPINGTVTGNVCEVILPASCYNVPGRYTFTMDVAANSESRTVLWVDGIVERNMSGDIIDPGTPVPNITAAINNANAAASAANAAATLANTAGTAAQEIVDNIDEMIDDIVLQQETEPTSETNKIWFPDEAGSETQIPTYQDYEDLLDAITPYHEDEMVATRAYVSGDVLMVGSTLYRTKSGISSGATLSSSNIEEITLREYLSGTGAALGAYAHGEGEGSRAVGQGSHAEGYMTVVPSTSKYGHSEGMQTAILNGNAAHVEGYKSQANGVGAHAEGSETFAAGSAHSEGYKTEASATYSHAEGRETEANKPQAHAEGKGTTASGTTSHAEGEDTVASGDVSHAEGYGSTASGIGSHAEGTHATASGVGAHAEGTTTTASGSYSHAEGEETIANHRNQHVFGTLNVADPSSAIADDPGTYVEIVGNGQGVTRSNARTLDWSGNEVLAGGLTLHAGTQHERNGSEAIAD